MNVGCAGKWLPLLLSVLASMTPVLEEATWIRAAAADANPLQPSPFLPTCPVPEPTMREPLLGQAALTWLLLCCAIVFFGLDLCHATTSLLMGALRLAAAPYKPLFRRMTRQDDIKTAHAQGYRVKSSSAKHKAYPPRTSSRWVKAGFPQATPVQRAAFAVLATLLFGTTGATAMQLGQAAGAFPGIASASQVNLQHAAAALAQQQPSLQQQPLPRGYMPPSQSRHAAQQPIVSPSSPSPAVIPGQQPAASAVGHAPAAVPTPGPQSGDQPPPHPFVRDCVTPFMPHGAVNQDPDSQLHKDEEHGWFVGAHPELTPEYREKLQQLLVARKHTCFAYHLADMPGYCGLDGEFTIELTTDRPILTKPRRYSPAEVKVRDAKCAELRDAGYITPAPPGTQYQSAPTMPGKKAPDGTWTDRRLCQDYRAINSHTKPDRYGLHLADDLFRQVGDARFFSKIDLRGAFHQIPIRKADQPKTAFWWGNQLWCYTRMPYGLVSGSAKCQRVMDTELAAAGLTGCALCFVDDLLVYSNSVEEHLQHVAAVLDMLHNCGLRAHPEKSIFFTEKVEFLGHLISAQGLSPHEAKVAAIRALSSPTCLTELRSKLAFINYYRCYIPDFSTIAAPLNALMRKDAVWCWGPEHETAFQTLKDIVCTPGVVLKRFDESLPITVYTDWSGVGIAAVLAQHTADGQEYMVACISRSLNPAERNYSSYEGEMLAAVWGVKAFRQYLHGLPFKLVTDHQPLKWLMGTPELTGKHMRWAMAMQEYEFTVEHRRGSAHANVDVPSRFPLASSHDPTGASLDPVLAATAEDYHSLLLPSPAGVLAAFPSLSPDDSLSTPGAAAAVRARYASDSVSRWLKAAGAKGTAVQPSVQQWAPVAGAQADHHDVFPTSQLSTVPVGPSFLAAAEESGIVLYEPFGGLCAGLDMVLSNGIAVSRYMYSDIDPAAQRVARARIAAMHAKYPHMFPVSASEHAFSSLPMDVRAVDTAALVTAGATWGQQWLVVAGWSCEDLSAAGTGRGLKGKRSSNFWDAVRIIGALQQLQPVLPPAYILENTAMQVAWNHSSIREHDFPVICSSIGQPVLVDAARFGSYAHRLRNWWSNLAAPEHVALVVDQVQRAPGRIVDAVLDRNHCAQPTTADDQLPFYPCNVAGQSMEALPTLVAYPKSRAFRGKGKGLLHVAGSKGMVEPNPDERERLMGYPTGATAAAGVGEADRHAITGRAMDRYTTVNLFSIYCALAAKGQGTSAHYSMATAPAGAQSTPSKPFYSSTAARIMRFSGWVPGLPLLAPSALDPIVEPVQILPNIGTRGIGYVPAQGEDALEHWEQPTVAELGGGTGASTSSAKQLGSFVRAFESFSIAAPSAYDRLADLTSPASEHSESDLLTHNVAMAAELGKQALDAHSDLGLLQFLRVGKLAPGVDAKEADRIMHRAKGYRWQNGQLCRIMPDSTVRIVPPADQRVDIILDTHNRTGHFGIKRTKHLLMGSYWWSGMEADVRKALGTCEVCAQVKAAFNAERPELQPLPVEGLFYRWGVDLAGPFPQSRAGSVYVMICIEHFSKQIEVIAIPAKEAKHTAVAFLSAVIARYGACAEVVTDRGTEFEGEFEQLLFECLIDHRTTSPNHPQADGLAERCVQTIKKALAKHVAQHRDLGDWDVQLHWIALGYRASRQAATGISPYELLYGVPAVVPPAIRGQVEQPMLDFANQEQAAEYVLRRAQLLQQRCAEAMGNLRIAQHRDKLRYQHVRSGLYRPSSFKFLEGDFVYLRRRTVVNALQSEARPGIYRIKTVKPSGVLVLQGRCGSTMSVNVTECAPCHLSNINPVLDASLQRVGDEFPCAVCESPDDEAHMLICDGCFAGYHTYCVQPPLASVPKEPVWLCAECKRTGLTAAGVWLLRQQNMPVAQSDAPLFPSAQQRSQDAAARELHGREVLLKGAGGQPVPGTLHYVPRTERMPHSRCPIAVEVPGQPQQRISFRKAQKLLAAAR